MIGIFKVNSKKDGGYFIDIYLQQIFKLKYEVQLFALHKDEFNIEGYNNIRINYKNIFKTIYILNQIILNNRISIFYTNQFITLLYAVLIRIIFSANFKIIAKVDGLTIKSGIKKWLYLIYDYCWDFAKKKADYIIFETEKAKKNYQFNNCEIIYTPATNFYNVELNILEKTNTINNIHENYNMIALFVGRYSFEKGFHLIEEIANRNSNILFITIGGNRKIFDKIDNITELGFQDFSVIVKYFNYCDFLIVPSIDDSFPSVIREFSYFNKPIIATRVGAMSEFSKLGLTISLCDNDIDSICLEINMLKSNYLPNTNRDIFQKWFDPNKEEIVNKYLNIISKFNSVT